MANKKINMAKVITFSRTYPSYHPKKGQQTYFVEKLYNSLYSKNNLMDYPKELDVDESILGIKHHTIRAGNRWKKGDFFSPRIWSGKPYNSKMITLAPDIEIKNIWDFEMDLNGVYSINGKYTDEETNYRLASNDGLTEIDMQFWFMPNMDKPKIFKGQIICWTGNINY